MPIDPRRIAAGAFLAAALTTWSCTPQETPPPPEPNGSSLPLRTGHWAGIMGTWRIDFFVDRVLSDRVAIHLVGGSIDPNAHNTPGNPVSFTDRPTTCRIDADGVSFDCLRYKGMHIDNGFLCGTYILNGHVRPLCFQPIAPSHRAARRTHSPSRAAAYKRTATVASREQPTVAIND